MPRFLVGDEGGYIKSLEYRAEAFEDGSRYRLNTLHHRGHDEQKISIQRMVSSPDNGGSEAVIAGYANGTVALLAFQEGQKRLEIAKEWKDSRFKKENSYIGLATSDNKIYSCTTNGALQVTTIVNPASDSTPTHQHTSLPTRLHDWKLSTDSVTFAYGGDEVELSVWNTEAAFQPRTEDLNTSAAASKKRKRNNELFPGEVWRAKNVANDSLGLRQPIRITSIDYLSTDPSGYHIITGTQLGDVRRYDTRAARRPVADWKGVGKTGGIQVVKKGLSDHELFISDHGTSLLSLDLRNGRVVYGYKGLSGAVTSIVPSPGILASVANDRYARIHSTFSPPIKEGQNLDHKGENLEKIYVTSVPTVAIWDSTSGDTKRASSPSNERDDDIWNGMEQIEDSDTERHSEIKRRHLS